MMRRLVLVALLLAAGPVRAEDCPAFYRFVEFGLVDRDGVLRPGGTVLRGIDAEGAPILMTAATVCRVTRGVRRDGPGNPIPIVSEAAFDPARLPLEVAALRIAAHGDVAAVTRANAAAHRANLARAMPVEGEDHLCVAFGDGQSCQVPSPYGPDHPLVVYCDARVCEMPALGFDDRVSVSAAWPRRSEDLDALGPEILAKVEALRAFLALHLSRAGR